MAAKQPRRKAAKGHKLPEPIPLGKEITDTHKKTWVLSEVIGSGGFGTVYFAADIKKPKDFDYVVKVEYHDNGPLFAEMHCYQNIAKPADLSNWVKERKLRYLGLSPGHGFGSFEYNGSKYRFMVIERYGKDLQKLLEENNGTFPVKTVCLIGLAVIDVLEYIHSCGYIHGDVKAANLLLGRKKGTENQVYLVDMGLACKYLRDGIHKKDLPDPKKSHNGTPEFTSRDAHRGSFSRRSDLEILAYNLLQWLTGRLPWEDFITDNNKLQKEKERHMKDVDKFLKVLFHGEKCPSGISKFLHYINDLEFEEEPNYDHCRKLLKDVLKSAGYQSNDYTLEFTVAKKTTKRTVDIPVTPAKEQVSNKENGIKKTKRACTKRKIAEPIQFEEGTVLTPAMQAVLRPWEKNLSRPFSIEVKNQSSSITKISSNSADQKSENELKSSEDGKEKNGTDFKGVDRLIENFRNLLNDELDSDLILKTNDHEFHAHRNILCAQCPVFDSMLHHDMIEKKTGEVDISDCTTAAFRLFLNFLYTGKADTMSSENVLDLYYITDKYQVDDLKSDCVEFMKNSLSVDNFCDIIALSLRHTESDLQKFATTFFCKNIKKIVRTVQWQKYITDYPIHANELIVKAINA